MQPAWCDETPPREILPQVWALLSGTQLVARANYLLESIRERMFEQGRIILINPEDSSKIAEEPLTEDEMATVIEKYLLTPSLGVHWKICLKCLETGNRFGSGMAWFRSVVRILSTKCYKNGSEALDSRGISCGPRLWDATDAAFWFETVVRGFRRPSAPTLAVVEVPPSRVVAAIRGLTRGVTAGSS